MNVIEVSTRREQRKFLDVPKILYKGDPHWVCPLDSEIEGIFDPKKNITFRKGRARRWVLEDASGKLIGRIAAFVDKERAKEYRQPTGGIGFFECIDDQEIANILFDTAKAWLVELGMEAMDGPINFGENQNHWGLLVMGFQQQGFGMPYNYPYYKELFENYGFKNYFEQYSYHRDLTTVLKFPERFEKIAEWVARKPDYDYRHFTFKESDKYLGDIIKIYNQTWASIKEDHTPMEFDDLKNIMLSAKPILDEEMIWFAYHKDDPIAFFILLPDVNQILKHMNGKMHPWNMMRFLYFKWTHKMTRLRAIIAGVAPDYQNLGIESAIFKHMFEVVDRKRFYRELELSWVGEYNPRMKSLYEAVGAVHTKTHITYRYIIKSGIPFTRYVDEMGYMLEKDAKSNM